MGLFFGASGHWGYFVELFVVFASEGGAFEAWVICAFVCLQEGSIVLVMGLLSAMDIAHHLTAHIVIPEEYMPDNPLLLTVIEDGLSLEHDNQQLEP